MATAWKLLILNLAAASKPEDANSIKAEKGGRMRRSGRNAVNEMLTDSKCRAARARPFDQRIGASAFSFLYVEEKMENWLVGADWTGSDFDGVSNALANMRQYLDLRELELTYPAGKPAYIGIKSPAETLIFPLGESVHTLLDQEGLKSVVAHAAQPYSIAESRLVTQYDAYYFDRDNQLRLPALVVRLDDPQQSLLYLGLYRGRVAKRCGRWERVDRWLYEGLHDFDFP